MIRIHTNRQEIEYKDLLFPFKIVKQAIKNAVPEAEYLRFCILRKFNTVTGEIDRKFAWDSVFQDLSKRGILSPILDQIIHDEYLK